MSSRRSRSGGTSIGTTSSRYNRSSRSVPAATALRGLAMGRGDHADVDGALAGRADGPHRAGLEHAQQLRLQRDRHLGELVEQQRAAVGRDEQARGDRGSRR